MRAIDFDVMNFLMRSLLFLLLGFDFAFFTFGACAFGIILSMVTLCISSGCVCSIGLITFGIGVVLSDLSFAGCSFLSMRVSGH
jgi:hypothetical protein